MSKFATFRYSPYTNSTNSQFNPALYNNKGAITGCVGTKDMRGGENIKTSSYYGLKAVDQNTASVLRGSYAPIVVQSHSQCAGGKKRKSRKNIKNKSRKSRKLKHVKKRTVKCKKCPCCKCKCKRKSRKSKKQRGGFPWSKKKQSSYPPLSEEDMQLSDQIFKQQMKQKKNSLQYDNNRDQQLQNLIEQYGEEEGALMFNKMMEQN
jgi:hypothetical protein